MPTPYDNTDGGKSYIAAERRIASNYGLDLEAPAQVRCDSCNQYADTDELDRSGNCFKCAGEIRREEAIAFMSAPTMAGCLSLMGVR